MKPLLKWIAAVALSLAFAGQTSAQPGNPDGITYKTGYAATIKFGMELHRALNPKYKPFVHARPINVDTEVTPYIRLEEVQNPELGKNMACVFVSAGFIDLVNNVAHAKAIDKIEKGYFQKYILSLSQESGDKELRELPNLSNKKYWTPEMINEQLSNFNQIVGVIVGIKLAHYYLGHYKKYEARLKDAKGNPVPINILLTPEEWEEALKCGVINSFRTGFMADGIKALFESIDKMPKRPEWTRFFLPENVKFSRIKKEVEKLEARSLRGDAFD